MSDQKVDEDVDIDVTRLSQNRASARPQITVYDLEGNPTKKHLPMPDVMLSPIRTDIVSFVHKNMSKNDRQPYAVLNQEGPRGRRAGMQVAARSWGTGRAVSRVPRVKGGGTHRAGQGAYANMCRGGRMASPTKVWRRWHRITNQKQRRHAVCAAVAASAVPALVMARGHRVQGVKELPLVVEDSFSDVLKTPAALNVLEALSLGDELRRCKRRYMRAGRGKSRNRRWRHRLGPLIVYDRKDSGIVRAARNIRGVDFCRVSQLNLLKLAPGGHVGRLVIWTEGAFAALPRIWGEGTKRRYSLPRQMMTNSDLTRLINSEEIQSAILPRSARKTHEPKRNPLKHPDLYAKLNPLFSEQWQPIKEKYQAESRRLPRTTRVLQMLKKEEKPAQLTEEEKTQMQAYWNNVFGDDNTYKTRKQLNLERAAVIEAMEAAEREKKGLDLMEALAAMEEADDDKEDN